MYFLGRNILHGCLIASRLVDSNPEGKHEGHDYEWFDIHGVHPDDEIKTGTYWVGETLTTYSEMPNVGVF